MKPNLIKEMQHRANLSSYQLAIVRQYIEWAYAIGADETREQWSGQNRRAVAKIKDGKILKIYPSLGKAARSVGVVRSAIHKAVNGHTKNCQGFKWKYVKQSA